MTINRYSISGYFLLLYVILQLLVVILLSNIVGYFKLYCHKLLIDILL